MISSALLSILAASIAPSDAPLPATSLVSPEPVQTAEEDVQGWSGSLNAGGFINTGNTETKTANLAAEVIWRGDTDRATMKALWNYQGDNESGVIQRKVYGSAQYDHFFNELSYGYGLVTDESDFASNLDERFTVGAGVGHQFREDVVWDIKGEAGVAFVDEVFDPTGGESSLALRLAYDFAYLESEVWEFSHGGQIYPSLEDSEDIYARWATNVKAEITDVIFAQFSWIWDYDNTPAPGNGRNNSLFALTVGWRF
ncbi:MAG: putative salt-induced outer membrane protein YdiY [Planctomycetota bacterium]|jgi:putative salt-induced outer membrane protein YdiY